MRRKFRLFFDVSDFLLLILFTGSVFITSGKFVNATNSPKIYFVAVVLLIIALIAVIDGGKRFQVRLKNKFVSWSLFLVVFAQACYGLFQFAGWLPSHHSNFAVTGSLDNPAGFAALLSIGFPVGLYVFKITNKMMRIVAGTALIVVFVTIILSGSRAGIVAVFISALVFIVTQDSAARLLKKFRFRKVLFILVAISLLGGSFLLYHYKKDSANGRLLIWKVSLEMIKDKPFTGHGPGAFKAKYMDYQAGYFLTHTDSRYRLLADNVKHPFNEFIKIAVEFGVIGLIIFLSLVIFVLLKVSQSQSNYKSVVLSGLASFLVFASFSYPLTYATVWLFIAFYLLSFFAPFKIKFKNTVPVIITRSVMALSCIFLLVHVVQQARREIKWKSTATSSLQGRTEEMLPEYKKLYSTTLRRNPLFLYNYGAELNVAGRYNESIFILTECMNRFNDYDLQMILADNYYKTGKLRQSVETYKHASNMIPCRFLPLYRLFEIYKEQDPKEMALKYARMIQKKKVKVSSSTVAFIQNQANEYLNEKRL